jgi:hypothetical protein
VDYDNQRVRRVGPEGRITTVVGSGMAGLGGDGGPAVQAQLDTPRRVAVGPDGSLYLTDGYDRRVRRVSPGGLITTAVGSIWGYSGDGGPPTQARLGNPEGIAIGPDGRLYPTFRTTPRLFE